jgi:hypothetical protein
VILQRQKRMQTILFAWLSKSILSFKKTRLVRVFCFE